MKSSLRTLFSFLILAISTLFFSCEKQCPEGFSGDDCEIRESDQFLGVYEGTVNCGLANEFTTVEIYRDKGPFDVKIDIYDVDDFILDATVQKDTLKIHEQILAIPSGQDTSYYIIFNTTGYLYQDTLDFPIVILYPGDNNQEKVTCQYLVVK